MTRKSLCGMGLAALFSLLLPACSQAVKATTKTADVAGSLTDAGADVAADSTSGDVPPGADTVGFDVPAEDVPPSVGLWTQIAVPGNPNTSLHAVWSDSTARVLAAGTGGSILGYDGQTWSVLTSGQFATFNGVGAAPGATTGFAVGIGGAIAQSISQDGKPGKIWGAPGGCKKPADCDDKDACTTDVCEAGTCVHSASGAAGCCGGAVFADSFDKGLGNWTVTDSYKGGSSGGVVWSAADMNGKDGSVRHTSPPAAAYFGRTDVPCPGKPGTFCPTFENGSVVGATLLSSEFSIPKAQKVLLSFQLLLDVQEGYYDQLQVSVIAPGGKVQVWDKYQQLQSGTTDGAFKLQTADLTQFAGQKIRIEVLFNSISAYDNGGEGVFIDDLLVSTTCAPASTSGKGVTDATLFGVWAAGDQDAWAVGTGGTILHWDGLKWSQAAGGAPKDILGLGGAQSGGAYAVGAAGMVAQMGAGGLSGLTVPAKGNLNAVVVSASKPEHTVIVGEGGTLIEGEGGVWKAADPMIFQGASLRSVAAFDDGSYVAVGGFPGYGQAFVKKAGAAATWAPIPNYFEGQINAIAATGPSSAFGVGQAGLLVTRNGDTWTSTPGGLGAEDMTAIYALSPQDAWAVGNYGTTIHYVDGTWNTISAQTAINLTGVWAASGKDVFACGPLGSIIHFDGTKWSDMLSPAVDWTSIWGRSSTDVFVGGKGGILGHWDGTAWSVISEPVTANLRTVWGSAADDVWTAGEKGTIYHWTGAGWGLTAIEPFEIPDQKPYKVQSTLLAIWGASKTDAWASGLPDADGHGVLVHWDGTSWKYIPALRDEIRTVRAIWGWKGDRMLLAGTDGMVYLWNGIEFKELHPQTIATLFGITGFGKDALLVGDIGTVLRFSPP